MGEKMLQAALKKNESKENKENDARSTQDQQNTIKGKL